MLVIGRIIRLVSVALITSDRRAEPHFGTVELTQLGVAKENAVYVLIHLFKPDLFVAEYLAHENAALVPADVSTVVHSPRLKRSRILKTCYPAGEQPSTWRVDASRRFVGKRFMWALKVEDQAETIELLLLRRHGSCRRLGCVFFQGAVHPFVSPVLLRVPGLNAFVNDAELHPSQRQLRKA